MARELITSGCEVLYFVKNKEILETLMIAEGAKYFKYKTSHIRKTDKSRVILSGIIDLFFQNVTLMAHCIRSRPQKMIGTDIAIAHVGWILKIPSYILNEDDFNVNRFFCSLAYPFARYIVSPNVCDVGKYQPKKIGYDGYQKLAYLHPKRFVPDRKLIGDYITADKYFIIRLVSLTAGHDVEQNHEGLLKQDVISIINALEEYGTVYISSENKLPVEFERHALKVPVNLVHHLMYFCELFISDSQSMTVESCMLGIPNIRVNTFVGQISVLEELENKYGLTVGIHPANKKQLSENINRILLNKNVKKEFQEKRDKMIAEKIDLTGFLYELLSSNKK